MDFPTIRRAAGAASDAISNGVDSLKAAAAARGLRMPGVGVPAPAPAVAPAAAPTSGLPNIDPSLIDRAKSAVGGAVDGVRSAAGSVADKVAGLRAPPTVIGADGIPTLTDVIKPGIAGPFPPQPEIPTLTDVLKPGHPALQDMRAPTNPSFAGGMSPERAAFNAEAGARMGPPAPPSTIGSTVAGGARDAGRFLKANAPTKLGALGTAVAAGAAYAPDLKDLGNDSDLTTGQQAKMFARDTMRAVGGVAGGAIGGGFGSVFAPVAGTIAGGVAGGYAGYEGADALAGGLRRGANWINEKLGGSPNYITSVDEDVAAARAKHPANPPVKDIIGEHYSDPEPTGAPTTPSDIAAFNARMKEVGAGSVGMRAITRAEIDRMNGAAGYTPDAEVTDSRTPVASMAGIQPGTKYAKQVNPVDIRPDDANLGSIGMRAGADSRVLENTAPASKEMQAYTDQHMRDRTAQFAAADAANREQGMRQMAYGQIMQNPDVVRLTDELSNAMRSGSPVAIQAASNARDNMIRTLSTEHQTQAQTSTTMRGQDIQAQGQRASNMLGMYNAQREQGNVDRAYQREVGNDKFTQGEAAEKHLDEQLTARFTTGQDKDGKPQVDTAAKNAAYAGIQRSAAALGVNSVQDLTKPDRERLIAGADLAAKVNKDATNWPVPWKPDVIGEVMPHDLIGLQKNSSGDYVIPRGAAKGRTIPARYLDKVGADHFGGQPTDIYDNLKAR